MFVWGKSLDTRQGKEVRFASSAEKDQKRPQSKSAVHLPLHSRSRFFSRIGVFPARQNLSVKFSVPPQEAMLMCHRKDL